MKWNKLRTIIWNYYYYVASLSPIYQNREPYLRTNC